MSDEINNPNNNEVEAQQVVLESPPYESTIMEEQLLAEALVSITDELPTVEVEPPATKKDIPGISATITLRQPMDSADKNNVVADIVALSMTNSTYSERSNPDLVPKSYWNHYTSAYAYSVGKKPDQERAIPVNAIDKDIIAYCEDHIASLETVPAKEMEDIYVKALDRDQSDWRQGVEINNAYVVGQSMDVSINEDTPVKGPAAIAAMKKKMGIGITHTFPAWHSGVYITLRSASSSALFDLDRMLVEEKTEYGFLSKGGIYASDNFLLNTRIADFVLNHVEWSNLSSNEHADVQQALSETLLITDIPLIVAGQAQLLFINGYQYHTVCTVNPEKCRDVRDTRLLKVTRMIFTDNSRLSRVQKDFMLDREKPRTIAEVRAYQKELFSRINNNSVKLDSQDNNDGVVINFRVPTLAEYRRESEIWFNTISSIIDAIPTTNLSENERDMLFKEHANIANIRKFSAYVDSIAMSQDKLIEDRETIRSIMTDVLSQDIRHVDKIYLGIKEFMADAIISLVALPRMPCSNCGAYADEEDKFHPHLIPQDAIELFLVLRGRRLLKGQQLTPLK